jgi:plastocyanin
MFLQRLLTGAFVAAATLTSVAGAPVGAPRVVTVVIDKATFEDVTDKLRIGDVVEWVNKDIVDHTATARNKDWDVAIPAGKKARVTLKKAGTVEYYCRYHPNMTARLVIR